MTDFKLVYGFEDVWRPPVRTYRLTPNTVPSAPAPSTVREVRSRLTRVISRAPEVVVKVTGRTQDPSHLRAHFDYISRNGDLKMETQDGVFISGRKEVKDLAGDWAAEQLADRRSRHGAPFSHSIVLSMPAGTDHVALRDASRSFAAEFFAGSHDYVFTLHTDTPRPHVHLSICSRGYNGERLNPRKSDLERWRQFFAQALRDRAVSAEATPRRARGVTRKTERGNLRRLRERAEGGVAEMSWTERSAYREAAMAAFYGDRMLREWERRTAERQSVVRGLYLSQARLLKISSNAADRALSEQIEDFVRSMPPLDSRRLALVRALRTLGRKADRSRKADLNSRGR